MPDANHCPLSKLMMSVFLGEICASFYETTALKNRMDSEDWHTFFVRLMHVEGSCCRCREEKEADTLTKGKKDAGHTASRQRNNY
jgi:hypothetical protein